VTFSFEPIGNARTPFTDPSQIPKGLGAEHNAVGVLDIAPAFEAGLADIEGFSHLCVLWVFDRVKGVELTAYPPADDRPHGVFATRSPLRPNPIGLTVVTLLDRDGCRLRVGGVDMLDGSPILDIKPYLSNVPPERLRRGWLAEAEARRGATQATPMSSISPFFVVSDLDAAVAFYRDKLGFTNSFRGPADSPFFAIVERDRAMIMLKVVEAPPLPNAVRDAAARWDAYVNVSDPDALAAEFTARGVRFSRPLADDDDGLRGFEVKDPDGYVLFFGRPRLVR